METHGDKVDCSYESHSIFRGVVCVTLKMTYRDMFVLMRTKRSIRVCLI